MRQIHHEQFSYSDSIFIVDGAIRLFYSDTHSNFNDFWELTRNEIIKKLLKPEKETVLHYYLWWIFNNSSLSKDLRANGYSRELIIFYELTLKDFGIETPVEIIPDYEYIEEHGFCEECRHCKKMIEYIDWIEDELFDFHPNMIHSAFHVLMLNKSFLRDFHIKIAEYIERDIEFFKTEYPNFVSNSGKIKRMSSWPAWLKKGIFFRDKGVCTICRNPLAGDLFLGINPDMDHIVPLDSYGNNDPSNLQILCNKCNNKKRNNSSSTSSYDIPYWNLPREN